MKGRPQSIPLNKIITNARLQNRNAASPCVRYKLAMTKPTLEHLDSLKNAIKRGDSLPPVMLVKAEDSKPGSFYLIDGFHRYWAHQQLNLKMIQAVVLEGQGMADALVATAGANLQHGLPLTKDQKIENAWRCLNYPETDVFRRMNKTQAAAALGVSPETIKHMRQKVKQFGVDLGVIDPDLKGTAANEALLAYWEVHPAPETWRMARKDGSAERTNPAWQDKKAAYLLAQILANVEGVYGAAVARKAFGLISYHIQGGTPESGMASIRSAFKVAPMPIQDEYDALVPEMDMDAFTEFKRQQYADFDYQPPPSMPFNEVIEGAQSDY